MRVQYSYLDDQFAAVDEYFEDIRKLVSTGEFTLGPFVEKFERKFADYLGVKHAVGTNTGTGAIILALKAVGVVPGTEVITVANTFIATAGAIIACGAKPVFVDSDERYQMDCSQLESAISDKTAAIMPVHWAGASPDMEMVINVSEKYKIPVVEDACPAVGAHIYGKYAGTFGKVNAFSMHPLKPLNVWGDGGIVVTDDDQSAEFLRLYRNHGLIDRNHVEIWGVNDRLQPVQAVVGSRVLDTIETLIDKRIHNANLLDRGLDSLSDYIIHPTRIEGHKEVYQLYLATATRRDDLLDFLINKEIEAKVHYPVPIHLQKAATDLGYKTGDFPVCEFQSENVITLPAHQYISDAQIEYILECLHMFYKS